MKKSSKYDAESIKVLDGIAHVRKRPSMYIGGVDKQGCFHIMREVVDNGLDEFANGHANRIWLTLSDDCNTVTVRDNGRGIPVAIHKDTKESTLTTVLTKLQAGGKFDSNSYKTSAGLHGVGVKATNATSASLTATVWREGGCWRQTFKQGKPSSKVTKCTAKGPKHGTEISFTPDPEIFKGIKTFYVAKEVRDWARNLVHLCPGLTLTYTHKGKSEDFSSDGLAGLVTSMSKSAGVELQHKPITITNKDGTVAVSFGWCEWTDEANSELRGYVNLVNTPEGGTHINGFRKAVVTALRAAFPKTEARPEELLDNCFAVISVKVKDPKFKGQTKGALNNAETEKDVHDAIRDTLVENFTKGAGKKIAKAVCERAKALAQAREATKKLRAAANSVAVAKNAKSVLPSKLAASDVHCPPAKRELFIVEGDSAGGSAKNGRDNSYQEVLPLRGKVVNTSRVTVAKAMENAEIQSLVMATGIKLDLRDPTKNDLSKMRVGKVCILADADPDGRHIASLVLTFITERMPQLIENGMVYVVKSPLFRGVSKDGKNRWYADSLSDLESKSGKKASTLNVSRLKGHGEATADELAIYAMDPNTRKMIRVDMEPKCRKRVRDLMGEDAAARKELLGIEDPRG